MSVSTLFTLAFNLACLALLSACVSHQQVAIKTTTACGQQVMIGETVCFELLNTPDELVGQSNANVLEIRYHSADKSDGLATTEQKTLIVQSQYQPNKIDLVAITPAGIPLFELAYSNKQPIKVTSYIKVDGLSPAYVLADMQLTHWPLAALNQGITGAILRESHTESEVVRELVSAAKKTIIRIRYFKDKIVFAHLERNYQLTITPVIS